MKSLNFILLFLFSCSFLNSGKSQTCFIVFHDEQTSEVIHDVKLNTESPRTVVNSDEDGVYTIRKFRKPISIEKENYLPAVLDKRDKKRHSDTIHYNLIPDNNEIIRRFESRKKVNSHEGEKEILVFDNSDELISYLKAKLLSAQLSFSSCAESMCQWGRTYKYLLIFEKDENGYFEWKSFRNSKQELSCRKLESYLISLIENFPLSELLDTDNLQTGAFIVPITLRIL